MCGCGRTSMPCPGLNTCGPICSRKTKGPTMRRSLCGSARRTLKPSPRSWVRGTTTVSMFKSSSCMLMSDGLRGDVDFAAQGLVHRAVVGDLGQACLLLVREIADVFDPAVQRVGRPLLAMAHRDPHLVHRPALAARIQVDGQR